MREAAEVVNTLWPKRQREKERGWHVLFRDRGALRIRVAKLTMPLQLCIKVVFRI